MAITRCHALMSENMDSVQKNPAANDDQTPVVRSQSIRTNADGLVCLNDLWAITGSDNNRRPYKWRRSALAKRLAGALADRIGRVSPNSTPPVLIDAKRGANGLTFAHIVLAQAYAEFLDDDLAVEVRQVFIRYRAGDASLADEILERASAEENRRAAVRAMGRVTRDKFTDVLQDHGVTQPYFGICTNVVYQTVLGKPAAALKRALGVAPKGSLRDAMSITQLAAVNFAEALSADRIEDIGCQGGPQCQEATAAASRTVRDALDTERRSRRGKPALPANDDGSQEAA